MCSLASLSRLSLRHEREEAHCRESDGSHGIGKSRTGSQQGRAHRGSAIQTGSRETCKTEKGSGKEGLQEWSVFRRWCTKKESDDRDFWGGIP